MKWICLSTFSSLTTEVQQVGVEERLAVELLNVYDGWALQAAAQGLLRATLISDEGFQHSPHHVQLQGEHVERRERKEEKYG